MQIVLFANLKGCAADPVDVVCGWRALVILHPAQEVGGRSEGFAEGEDLTQAGFGVGDEFAAEGVGWAIEVAQEGEKVGGAGAA